ARAEDRLEVPGSRQEQPGGDDDESQALADELAVARQRAVADEPDAGRTGTDERPRIGPALVVVRQLLVPEQEPDRRHDAARDREAEALRRLGHHGRGED